MIISEEMKTVFEHMLDTKGNFNATKYKLYKTDETDKLLELCFNSYRNFSFYIKNNLSEIPKCPVCGSELKNFGKGQILCSMACYRKYEVSKEKRKKTSLERYGTENPTQNKQIRNKINQTNIEKYGGNAPIQNKEVQDKIKQTNIERYGVDNTLKTKEVRDKAKSTMLEKYGVEYAVQNTDLLEKRNKTNIERYGTDNPLKSKEVRKKMEQTNLERYGVENVFQSKEIQDKAKFTMLKKYGVENSFHFGKIRDKRDKTMYEKYNTTVPLKNDNIKSKLKKTNLQKYGYSCGLESPEIQNKIRATNLEKYGVENFAFSDEFRKQRREQRYPIFLKQIESTTIELLSPKEEFINSEQIRYKCKLCGTEFTSDKSNIQLIHCPNCYVHRSSSSNKELEVKSFIQNILPNKEIIANDRKTIYPLELDIYIPDKNLAIEFNGDYWHSEYYKDKNYHLDKTLKCNSKGIKLIHIFEHEWDFRRPIVESILRNALGLIENHIYARKCFVSEISQREYSNFLELNHIQGSIVSKYRYGLFYQNELVSVIGFGSSRFKKGEIELHRFCSKINTSVIGGFSKLIKYFMNQNICSEFITYVDRSKFDAKGYFKIGFKILSETDSSYFYAREGEILSRYQCQKHKLSKLLENYDPSLSESDNMILNGYTKVYDCGTLKLVYKNKIKKINISDFL